MSAPETSPVSQRLEGRRILVTGAGGFLGPHVVDTLTSEGARVVALAGPAGEDVRVPEAAARVVRGDVRDAELMEELVAGAEVVVHMAGPASVAASFEDPARFIRAHTEGTAVVLEACHRRRVGQLVYVSSAEVYGRPRAIPVDERHPLEARSPYAAAKIGAEKLVEAFTLAHGLRAVILRPFSIYGPGAVAQGLIPQIIGMARAKGHVTVRDPRPVRDYCWVGDVARGAALACCARPARLEIFNLGTGTGTSVEQVASLVLSLLGLHGPVLTQEPRGRPGESEIHELVADCSRAKDVLNWRPRVSLEQGLRMTLGGERP